MFKKVNFVHAFTYGAIGATLFSIPVFIFIRQAVYTNSWLLFLGSVLYFGVIALATYRESKLRGGNESTVALVFMAQVTIVIGILISVLFCFILMVLLVPGYLTPGDTATSLDLQPPNSIFDKTNGLSFKVFMAATAINFAGGSIAGITIPFYAKRNQTKDSREPTPLQHRTTD